VTPSDDQSAAKSDSVERVSSRLSSVMKPSELLQDVVQLELREFTDLR
jgi:hypothetical protein